MMFGGGNVMGPSCAEARAEANTIAAASQKPLCIASPRRAEAMPCQPSVLRWAKTSGTQPLRLIGDVHPPGLGRAGCPKYRGRSAKPQAGRHCKNCRSVVGEVGTTSAL